MYKIGDFTNFDFPTFLTIQLCHLFENDWNTEGMHKIKHKLCNCLSTEEMPNCSTFWCTKQGWVNRYQLQISCSFHRVKTNVIIVGKGRTETYSCLGSNRFTIKDIKGTSEITVHEINDKIRGKGCFCVYKCNGILDFTKEIKCNK